MTSNTFFASIWWSNEMWEGSEKGGKILVEIFWGNWEREKVFALEFATVISNYIWANMTIQKLWAPRGQKFYNLATELCNSETENTNLVFLVFITLTQPKLSLSDESRERKSSQTLSSQWVPHNSQFEWWELSHMTQNRTNPNRALHFPIGLH